MKKTIWILLVSLIGVNGYSDHRVLIHEELPLPGVINVSSNSHLGYSVTSVIVTNDTEPKIETANWYNAVTCMTNVLWYYNNDLSKERENQIRKEYEYPKTNTVTKWITSNTTYKLYIDNEVISEKKTIKLLKVVTKTYVIDQNFKTNLVETKEEMK